MDNLAFIGRWLVFAGLAAAAVGGILWLISRITGLEQLPGSIRIEGSGFSCVFPLLVSIVLSVVLTLVLNLVIRLLNR